MMQGAAFFCARPHLALLSTLPVLTSPLWRGGLPLPLLPSGYSPAATPLFVPAIPVPRGNVPRAAQSTSRPSSREAWLPRLNRMFAGAGPNVCWRRRIGSEVGTSISLAAYTGVSEPPVS